jgi:Protein of unknown function (DUF2971)
VRKPFLNTNTEARRLLYKYRRFSDRTIGILTSKKLYFPRADELNDPLDSQIDIQLEYERAEKELSRRFSGKELTGKQFLLFLLNSHRFRDKESQKKIGLNEALQQWIRHRGILSLSKNPCDALLWAHYGGGHTGLCLGFDVSKMFSEEPLGGEVEYVASPRYRELFLSLVEELGEFVKPWEDGSTYPNEVGDKFYTRQIYQITQEGMFVKSEKWKYEEEFRIVRDRSGLHGYDPSSLREIVFGTKTRDADIKRITDIVKASEWQHVSVKRAVHVPGSFEFKITDHPV